MSLKMHHPYHSEQMYCLLRAHGPRDDRNDTASVVISTGIFCSRACDVNVDI